MDALSGPFRAHQNRELSTPQEEILTKKQRCTGGAALLSMRGGCN
jgi:hypothetical protein